MADVRLVVLSIAVLWGFVLPLEGVPVALDFEDGRAAYVNKSEMAFETIYFKQLNTEERIWLLNTSMLLHVLDERVRLEGGGPVSYEDLVGPAPGTLYRKLVNGNIPSDFQQLLVTWLTEELFYTSNDMERLTRGEEVCGTVVCSSLPGLGQTCCPFG